MVAHTPPMVSGAKPVVGHVFEMLRDRASLFKRGYAEHGDVFSMKLGPQPVAVISGAEYNRQFYAETDKALNMQDGYIFLKEAVGNVLFVASPETYQNQRPAQMQVFRHERMVQYIQAMYVEVQRWLDSLGESGEVDVARAMLRLTQLVVGRSLIGPDYERELGPGFWQNYEAISRSLDPILPPNLPLPKFIRRDRARRNLERTLLRLIQERRANPGEHDDLITTLLSTPLKDGSAMTDETIATMFIAFMFAGHETTAGQAGWLIALLLQHPDFLDLVKAEIRDKVPYGHAVDASVLSGLTNIYYAVDETTRLQPSADVQIRTVESPIAIGGYDIPVGWRVMVSGATSHFLPDAFANPEQFDPLRFSPERGEGKNSFAIIGFGGGVHKCTGMNFAKNEMAMITALLFQQFDLELLSTDIRVVSGKGANRPSEVRVRYRRKPHSELVSGAGVSAGACPHAHQPALTEAS